MIIAPGTPIIDRLNARRRITLKGCHLWTGARNDAGYGVIQIEGKFYLVHRLRWRERYGQLPDGKKILQSCGHRHCFNLSHLFVGDPRIVRATTTKQRADILRRCYNGETLREVAVRYGIHWQTVYRIVGRRCIKLSGAQIADIRQRREAVETIKRIAGDYGLSLARICFVTRGFKDKRKHYRCVCGHEWRQQSPLLLPPKQCNRCHRQFRQRKKKV